MSLWIKSLSLTIQMKATTGNTFLWCCFDITLCEVVLTLVSVDEILKFDHSNESYIAERCTLELA